MLFFLFVLFLFVFELWCTAVFILWVCFCIVVCLLFVNVYVGFCLVIVKHFCV